MILHLKYILHFLDLKFVIMDNFVFVLLSNKVRVTWLQVIQIEREDSNCYYWENA